MAQYSPNTITLRFLSPPCCAVERNFGWLFVKIVLKFYKLVRREAPRACRHVQRLMISKAYAIPPTPMRLVRSSLWVSQTGLRLCWVVRWQSLNGPKSI